MNNNSVLVNKIIKMGVTDPVVAREMIARYLRTGKLTA